MDLLFDYEAYCTSLLLARRVLNSLRWMRNMLATRRYMQSILLMFLWFLITNANFDDVFQNHVVQE